MLCSTTTVSISRLCCPLVLFRNAIFPTGGLLPAHEEQHVGNCRGGGRVVSSAVVCPQGDSGGISPGQDGIACMQTGDSEGCGADKVQLAVAVGLFLLYRLVCSWMFWCGLRCGFGSGVACPLVFSITRNRLPARGSAEGARPGASSLLCGRV